MTQAKVIRPENKFWNEYKWNYLKITILIILFCLAQAWLNLRLRGLDIPWVDVGESESAKTDPNMVKVASLGFYPVVIDWLLLKILVDPSIAQVEKGHHPAMYYNFMLATDLDPGFFDLYSIGGNLLSVIFRDGPGAAELLNQGNEFFKTQLFLYPESFTQRFWSGRWALAVLMAYNYLFVLEDMPLAAKAFRQSAVLPSAPAYLTRLAKRLEAPGGEYEVGLKLLNFLRISSADPRIKKELEIKRQNLFVGQYLFEMNQSFLKYLKTQPSYLRSTSVTSAQMEVYWRDFLKATQTQDLDPWGGHVSVSSSGKVISSTPHEVVFGLN